MQNTKKPTIIGIAGGTSSGKTTIANRLYDEAIKTGTVALIKIDDYYHNKYNVQKLAKLTMTTLIHMIPTI